MYFWKNDKQDRQLHHKTYKTKFKLKKTLILLLCVFSFLNCEKDDLCAAETPTTPRLIIDFYNVSEQANQKNVPTLIAKGVDNDQILENYKATTSNQVILPLKTNEDSTQFSLYNSGELDDNGNIIAGNEDILTITYKREEVFISRACGYKTVFKDIAIVDENDTDKWIQFIQPLNDNQSVEDETTTHFKLFH